MPKFTVETNKSYLATIRLTGFEVMATNYQVGQKLNDLGFRNVEVNGDGDLREASGTWLGVNTTVELPEQVAKIEEVKIEYVDDPKTA